ncbi:hypothetical protein Z042_14660 [Chania multitudinisentens RB-25]|uniref:Integrase n=1 Tax=Chania multitudinisentens RB-25 TaxID=1441930 RepID=W0LEK6_9GAMM|nr:integrase arm-type DNA-binding domain-containing protein [Chania multitudinisentens]AHG20712.1 hypothetical protein Z042_14660 [Chania multitudinisentens RB-25]
MALTEITVRQARATGKDYTLYDSHGLSLSIRAQGGKAWLFRYHWHGQQKRLSLGTYPAIGLKAARQRRDEARTLVVQGIDPRTLRQPKTSPSVLTFHTVYQHWYDFRALSLKTGRQSTLSQIERIFKKDVLPHLGERPIHDIKRTDLLNVLNRIEQRRAYTTAEKVRTWFKQLFRYALVKHNLDTHPATELNIVAHPKPPVAHNPYLHMHELPAFLHTLHQYPSLITQLGIRLLLLTGVRTGELRHATPEQFDLPNNLWLIPPENVKQLQRQTKEGKAVLPYIVPLTRQARLIIDYLFQQKTSAQHYLLPSRSDPKQPISENTLNGTLKRMGYTNRLTGHGIRATLSTALNELGYPGEWIEAQLSHADPNKIRAAYNHAAYIEQRRSMMQDWADRLDQWEQEGTQNGQTEPVPVIPAKPKPVPSQPDSQQQETAAQAQNAPNPILTIISRKEQRPQPMLTDIQRQRAKQLETFEAAHNLPLPAFARLAGKSRDQITRDIKAGRLLALSLGKAPLIKHILTHTQGTDPWHLYHALTEPLEEEGGAVIDQLTAQNLKTLTRELCRQLQRT